MVRLPRNMDWTLKFSTSGRGASGVSPCRPRPKSWLEICLPHHWNLAQVQKTIAASAPLWIISLDLSKACDKVDWNALWAALRQHRIPEHLIFYIFFFSPLPFSRVSLCPGLFYWSVSRLPGLLRSGLEGSWDRWRGGVLRRAPGFPPHWCGLSNFGRLIWILQ